MFLCTCCVCRALISTPRVEGLGCGGADEHHATEVYLDGAVACASS